MTSISFQRKIKRTGNSFCVIIPTEIMIALNLKLNDDIVESIRNDTILLRKIK